ncbi:MAG TPA: GIY-YIG nuclease family protein [Gemmatimonadales bacterium]|jgi:putative endonuclease
MALTFHVYILASRSHVLYIGVTRSLYRRLQDHSLGEGSAFVRKYHVKRLVYVEVCGRAVDAFAREKQLKGWRRLKKITLIESMNPEWHDLADDCGWRPLLDSAVKGSTSPHPGRSGRAHPEGYS